MGMLAHARGSAAERRLQKELGTREKAQRFYDRQVLDHLNDPMAAFVRRQQMVFVATAGAAGTCDNSFRGGPAGFVQVLGPRLVAYPEYRGNGVMASLANITENAHVALLFVDFLDDVIGLHVNGRASLIESADIAGVADRAESAGLDLSDEGARRAERWVAVDVEEAYIHCPKYIPRLGRVPRSRFWARQRRPRRDGGDFFGVRAASTTSRGQ